MTQIDLIQISATNQKSPRGATTAVRAKYSSVMCGLQTRWGSVPCRVDFMLQGREAPITWHSAVSLYTTTQNILRFKSPAWCIDKREQILLVMSSSSCDFFSDSRSRRESHHPVDHSNELPLPSASASGIGVCLLFGASVLVFPRNHSHTRQHGTQHICNEQVDTCFCCG